jgi:hypothetical protein
MAPHTAAYATVYFGQRIMASLVAILKKASKASDSASFAQARIYEDMLPLSFQVRDTGRHTMRALRAATGKALETADLDYEKATTMAELIEYAEAVLAVANSVRNPDDLDADAEEATKTFELPMGSFTLKGLDWMLSFALPNAYFHLTTAYNILRMKGVPLQKLDYIVPFMSEETLKAFGRN